MAVSKADKLMKEFVKKSKHALKDYDRLIYENIKKTEHKRFYEKEGKGLWVLGITEQVVRFLIYTQLCKKYRILPERQYENSRCRADLVIYMDDEKSENEQPPDITVEIKWCEFRETYEPGSLYKSSKNSFEEDLRKLRDLSESPNNYLLQIAFAPRHLPIKDEIHKVNDKISGHITRYYDVKPLTTEHFFTRSKTEKKDYSFWLICWKLVKKC